MSPGATAHLALKVRRRDIAFERIERAGLSLALTWQGRNMGVIGCRALVQVAGSAELNAIDMDALLIEEDGIPDSGRCRVIEPEIAEINA